MWQRENVMSYPGQPTIKFSPNIFVWKAKKNLVLLEKWWCTQGLETLSVSLSFIGPHFCFACEDSHIMHYGSAKISQCALITHI